MHAPPQITPRISWLDWVRGIAATAVMVHHFLEQLLPAYEAFSRDVFDMGRAGVIAFFVVSGFVIPLTYSRQTTSVFLVRRATRLFPVYWLVLIATILFFPRGSWDDPQWWAEIALNATMMQSLFVPAIIGVAWTLTIEWVFYLQQIGAKTFRLLDKAWLLGYFWAALFVVVLGAEHILGRELPISLPAMLAIACVGHAFSLWYSARLSTRTMLLIMTIVIGTIIFASFFRADVDPLWPGHLYAISTLGGLLFVAIAYALRNRLRLRWALWLGSISYSIYLVHSFFTQPLHFVEDPLGRWLVAVVGIIATILVSWLVKVVIEQPSIKLGRRFKPRVLR